MKVFVEIVNSMKILIDPEGRLMFVNIFTSATELQGDPLVHQFRNRRLQHHAFKDVLILMLIGFVTKKSLKMIHRFQWKFTEFVAYSPQQIYYQVLSIRR